MVDKLALRDCHMGPMQLPEGAEFSQQLADSIFQDTQVRAHYRARKQWGPGKQLILIGPNAKLEEALALVVQYGTDPDLIEEVRRFRAPSSPEKTRTRKT